MEPISASVLLNVLLMGVLGFLGWLVKGKWTKVDDHAQRLTTIETRLSVLGDINQTLNSLRTDIEVIKARTEKD